MTDDTASTLFCWPDGTLCHDFRLAGITAADFEEPDVETRARSIIADFVRDCREPTNAELDAIEREQRKQPRPGFREAVAARIEARALNWVIWLVELVRG